MTIQLLTDESDLPDYDTESVYRACSMSGTKAQGSSACCMAYFFAQAFMTSCGAADSALFVTWDFVLSVDNPGKVLCHLEQTLKAHIRLGMGSRSIMVLHVYAKGGRPTVCACVCV